MTENAAVLVQETDSRIEPRTSREPQPAQVPRGTVLDPVFVICNGRSGSTLLRFLLDAHPELACPPETNLPALCAQLATVWSLIEGAPLSANRGDAPPAIPEAAISGIRHTMDLMIGSYLTRRGKRRYCDKSLGTARFAELLLRVYPRAKFICLYRHPMDVIASGIEACPWGVNGYGFDPYIAETPGNAVLALARFWVDNAGTVLATEDKFPEHCHRVLYEDLVAEPERAAAELFDFLEVAQVPGITSACFSAERERFGPGDYKIWCTTRVTDESVGRGWSLPVGMIAPPVLSALNDLAGKLGYVPVDEGWGTTVPPGDLRIGPGTDMGTNTDAAEAGTGTHSGAGAIDVDAGAETDPETDANANADRVLSLLGGQLKAGLARLSVTDTTIARWGPQAAERFVVVVLPSRNAVGVTDAADSAVAEYWLVDLKAGTVALAGPEAQEKSDWDVVGTLDAWQQVAERALNMNVALRSCRIRYCDEADAGPVIADIRLGILAALLGIVNW